MVDTLTKEQRSRVMSRIRGKDTGPERLLRSVLHRMGFRFRLHRRDLPGRPDVVLAKYRTAIFVHGCFWHRHTGCRLCYTPKSRVSFWKRKFEENVLRDRRVRRQLKKQGWKVLVIWECELQDVERVSMRIRSALGARQ
jgi:DNA mismatch endonuclease (patch repair protein)